MRTTLRAIADHPQLKLQLIATGVHLDRSRGHSIDQIRADGFTIDATVPWKSSGTDPVATACNTGAALIKLASTFAKLETDIILVVGDRVEAFAAASAAHISGKLVAHVHGGDRALGQVDDALRHAITKLSHIHFAATKQSAERVIKLGEDRFRIHQVGAPGIDGIQAAASPSKELLQRFEVVRNQFGLIAYHPAGANERGEQVIARRIAKETLQAIGRVLIVCPNNDPGSPGIMRAWEALARQGDRRVTVIRDLPRNQFLGLMRDAKFLIGNSSAGKIEAASFGTAVIDVGTRQSGRETSSNVVHVNAATAAIRRAIDALPERRNATRNVYGGQGAGDRIARLLSSIDPKSNLWRRKLIAY